MCLQGKLLCKIDKHTPHLLVTPEYNFCDRHQKFLSSHLVAAFLSNSVPLSALTPVLAHEQVCTPCKMKLIPFGAF